MSQMYLIPFAFLNFNSKFSNHALTLYTLLWLTEVFCTDSLGQLETLHSVPCIFLKYVSKMCKFSIVLNFTKGLLTPYN